MRTKNNVLIDNRISSHIFQECWSYLRNKSNVGIEIERVWKSFLFLSWSKQEGRIIHIIFKKIKCYVISTLRRSLFKNVFDFVSYFDGFVISPCFAYNYRNLKIFSTPTLTQRFQNVTHLFTYNMRWQSFKTSTFKLYEILIAY